MPFRSRKVKHSIYGCNIVYYTQYNNAICPAILLACNGIYFPSTSSYISLHKLCNLYQVNPSIYNRCTTSNLLIEIRFTYRNGRAFIPNPIIKKPLENIIFTMSNFAFKVVWRPNKNVKPSCFICCTDMINSLMYKSWIPLFSTFNLPFSVVKKPSYRMWKNSNSSLKSTFWEYSNGASSHIPISFSYLQDNLNNHYSHNTKTK
jgi:hypothetical protein